MPFMGKRDADEDITSLDGAQDSKRQKHDPRPQPEEISSARQLQDVLRFQQDAVQNLRNGVASFKTLLENILYVKDEQTRGAHLSILREYLDTAQSKSSGQQNAVFFPDLMQAWAFAQQTNNDHLASAVSSILALLLKTLSTLLELREHGLSLCRTLLQLDQLKIIQRSLSAPRHKEHIISPCLRMLTELVSFDGGALASRLFARRDLTLESKILARNLALSKSIAGDDPRKPSVRSNAVRYLLANLRYQSDINKIDLLRDGLKGSQLFKTLFDHLHDDNPELFHHILQTLETRVLKPESIPRWLKSSLLSERSLSSVINVVRTAEDIAVDPSATQDGDQQSPLVNRRAEALAFLHAVCTTPSLGVLLPSSWYPPNTEKLGDSDEVINDGGAEADFQSAFADHHESSMDQVVVRNKNLASFLQHLRPHSNLEERALMLAIFGAAPELVADYFLQRKDKLSFEPKLTNTWIGYASLFFSAVELPTPPYFGLEEQYGALPPSTTVAMENVLPAPLSHKVLTRCFLQSSELITLFAIRILVKSFEKLQNTLNMFRSAASQGEEHWQEASVDLLAEFCQRCPSVKDVLIVFRRTPDSQNVLKEAVTHLLKLYYTVTPELTTEDALDLSATLANALARAPVSDDGQELKELELQHLLVLAQMASGMRWWNKQGQLQYSPFVSLLQLCTTIPKESGRLAELKSIIHSVTLEHGILQQSTTTPSTDALLASLRPDENWSATNATWNFVDECIGRIVRKPIKYLDDLDNMTAERHSSSGSLSLLVMVCLEQAPFTSRLSTEDRSSILSWISRLFTLLEVVGEDKALLNIVRSSIGSEGLKLPSVSTSTLANGLNIVKQSEPDARNHSATNPPTSSETKQHRKPIVFVDPPVEKDTHRELQRWEKMDLDDAIENGVVGQLLLCACSQYPEIRRQGNDALQKLMAKVEESSHDRGDQLWLLFGELIDSAKDNLDFKQLPYILGAFATAALKVEVDPLHVMYPKVNKFLAKGPSWNVGKLIDFWLKSVLIEIPDEDDAHWKEVEWVLDLLVDGLRTPKDMSVYRSRNVFEPVLTLFHSPMATYSAQERILQLLYRAVKCGGGTTLITNCGLPVFLGMVKTSSRIDSTAIQTLAMQLLEHSDHDRLDEWSGGAWRRELQALSKPVA